MVFLFPAFLWALFLIAIPIIIYLFNFRRTQKIDFTNVAFLRTVKTSTNSFRKLRDILILICRILFIAMLVFAFAQPFINKNKQSPVKDNSITSIYIDNSLSMQSESDNLKYLDIAVKQVDQLANALPATTKFQLITNNFESNEQVIINKDKLKDRITEIRFSNTHKTAESIYQRQLNLLKNANQINKNRLIWVSDFQKSTLGDLSKLKIDSLNQFIIVPVQSNNVGNIYVDSVWLAVPFIREMESNTLHVRLINTGKDKVENMAVKFFIDNQQASTTAITIEANSNGIASFNFTIQDKGYKKCKISFNDQPITFDNDYFFVLNAAPIIQVVQLYGKPNHKFVESVFSNESLFKLKSFNGNATEPSVINTADLVVLDEIDNINPAFVIALQNYIRKGGNIAIFPSGNIDITSYNNLLNGSGIINVKKNTILPSGTENNSALSLPDVNQPFFNSIFENIGQKNAVSMPNAQAVISWSKTGNSLLKYKNSDPFLTQTTFGLGKIYLFASPLSLDFNNLAKHALFVPIMYKIAALSKAQEQMAYNFASQNIVVDVDKDEKDQVYHLKKDNFDMIPHQQLNDKQLVFEFPQSSQTSNEQGLEAGYYDLTMKGKSQKYLAFNYDKQESQLKFYSILELKQIFSKNKNIQIYNSAVDKDFVNDFKQQNIGLSLWKYFLIAALFFMLLEILIIRFLK